MRCIFCKLQSSNSSSVEHILPESLGNVEHVLPRGVVCDSCNNYFARKLELPVLASPMLRLLRSDRRIPNKRGIVPLSDGDSTLPDYRLMSRFLGKVGLEVFAERVQQVPDWNREVVDHGGLDQLRQYVRFNRASEVWPFHHRPLYPVNAVFEERDVRFEVLHEWTVLYTDTAELYAAVAILGVEFVLNLGAPLLDGYKRWLREHNNRSPLYREGLPAWGIS